MRARWYMMLLAAVASGCLCAATEVGALGASPLAGATTSAVVATTMTFVDSSRPMPAWNGTPQKPSWTLVTTIWYPAPGVGINGQRPVPAHRLRPRPGGLASGLPAAVEGLGRRWLRRGSPRCFHSRAVRTPGGPDGGDIGNQPGDMSFVIDQVLKASATSAGPLSGPGRSERNRGSGSLQRCNHDIGFGGQHVLSRCSGSRQRSSWRAPPKDWVVAATSSRMRRRCSVVSGSATTDSSPTAMQCPSSTKRGDRRRSSRSIGTAPPTAPVDGSHGLLRSGRP